MSPPQVSVIVPAYNAQVTLEDCIRSLLEMDFARDRREILVVDNASTDATPEILARWAGDIQILHEPKRGPAAARNRGLESARGEIVAFTDADCTVERGWLRELMLPLANPRVGIVGGRIVSRQPCNRVEAFGERIHDHRLAIDVFRPPYAITMNWASRMPLLREVGTFDESLLRCEDVDLAYRVFAAGYRLEFAPTAVVYHRNEATLLGLLREGYAHGYHAVRVRTKHGDFLRRFRGRDGRTGRERLYEIVFKAGKRAGGVVARLRNGTFITPVKP